MKKILLFMLATVMMLSMVINVSADKDISSSKNIYEKDANGTQTNNIVAVATYSIYYSSGANCVRASNNIRYDKDLHESQYNFPAYIDLYVSIIRNSNEVGHEETNIGYINTRNGSINVDFYVPSGIVSGTVYAYFETNTRRVTSSGALYYNNGNFSAVTHNMNLSIP